MLSLPVFFIDTQVSFNELQLSFNRWGMNVIYEDGLDVMHEMDTDKDGYISYAELKAWVRTDHRKSRKTVIEEQIRRSEYERSPTHSKHIVDSGVSYGGVLSTHGATDKQERFYSSGKPMSMGRKTSAAFGEQHQWRSRDIDAHATRQSRRFEVRAKLTKQLQGKGEAGLRKMWRELCRYKNHMMMDGSSDDDGEYDSDGEDSGLDEEKVPFLAFKRWLNHKGMSVMHEDAAALMKQLDTDEDGLLSYDVCIISI